jgi:hypothetical protein
MDFCLMENILPFSDDFRVYVQSLEGDEPRPITPPGVSSFGIFTADGKYVLAKDSHETWALYPIGSGQPIALPKWTAGDVPINHTTDNHSFFVSHGNNPVVDIYRFDFLNGTRQFVRQLRPADATGTEGISEVLMTPDGKGYEYGGVRRLSNLFVVTGMK